MEVDVHVEAPVSSSSRAMQLEGMFDVPHIEIAERDWHVEMPLDEQPWHVGLIVGPSGAGKTLIGRKAFGIEHTLEWGALSVVDDFADALSMDDISLVCQAVGFNTIPAWLRPFAVLSNGEQFRVTMARTLLEAPNDRPIFVDEFTSVVDRQVAKIGAHAVQKYVRRHDRQFVAATCHYDVEDWLQPDWVLDPAAGTFRWRSVQPRPRLNVEIVGVDYSAWRMFAPFHYLTSELHRAARCFVLLVEGEPAAFVGTLHRPHPKTKNITGVSRIVTLPDWQGLGLAFVLLDTLGAVYKAAGRRLRGYPAHPALIHNMDRSKVWTLKQKPGYGGSSHGATRTGPRSIGKPSAHAGFTAGPNAEIGGDGWAHGGRPCAVFEYAGPPFEDVDLARCMLGLDSTS